MADKTCPHYFTKRNLLNKITEECCDSVSKYHSIGNYGGLGEPADMNLCNCDNYKECPWFKEDSELEKVSNEFF